MIISLETITTVGYSVSDINFGPFPSLTSLSGDHTLAFFLLYGEMMQAILMNSFCIGIVYTRLSRAIVLLSPFSLPQTRSRSLIFSNQAIIKRIHGQWCFIFQVCELRKHQLVESCISCYSVQKTINDASGVPFQMTRMQLTVPFFLFFLRTAPFFAEQRISRPHAPRARGTPRGDLSPSAIPSTRSRRSSPTSSPRRCR